MRSGLVVAVAALVVSAVPATPTWAEAERRAPLVSAVDASGDVKIRDFDGPSDAERRNADLVGFKISRTDDTVTITFKIARVSTSTKFDQMLSVIFVDADPAEPRVAGQATLRVQHAKSAWSDASVDTENASSGSGCFQYPFVVNRTQSTVKLHLDLLCLPPGALSIRAKAFTTTLKGERRTVYSRDFLRLPDSHDLGGLAGSEQGP